MKELFARSADTTLSRILNNVRVHVENLNFETQCLARWKLTLITDAQSAKICIALVHNVGVCAERGIGGLGNEAKRNAKTDQLRPVPRAKCK